MNAPSYTRDLLFDSWSVVCEDIDSLNAPDRASPCEWPTSCTSLENCLAVLMLPILLLLPKQMTRPLGYCFGSILLCQYSICLCLWQVLQLSQLSHNNQGLHVFLVRPYTWNAFAVLSKNCSPPLSLHYVIVQFQRFLVLTQYGYVGTQQWII